jgi:hypothetical protein
MMLESACLLVVGRYQLGGLFPVGRRGVLVQAGAPFFVADNTAGKSIESREKALDFPLR